MTLSAPLATAVLALTLLAGDALAASVTCQSRNMQREDCWLSGRGALVLVRQISKTTCVKGRNWDETRDGLYVTDGCGGVFETRGSGAGWNDRPGQGSGWSGNPGWQDLVGAGAASGEDELRRRGFRDARNEPAPGGRFVFWRTPARGCIEVRVVDSRFQAIRPVGGDACDGGGRPYPPTGPVPGPVTGPGSTGQPSAKALFACNQQINNSGAGNDHQDATVERQSRLRQDQWELVLSNPQARFSCTVTDRGRVQSFSRLR